MSGNFAKATGMVREHRPERGTDVGKLANVALPIPRRPVEPSYPVLRWDSPDCQPIKLRGHRAR